MKILLIHPNATMPWAELHLGLAYIGAVLLQAGHEVSLIDTRVSPIEYALAAVSRGEYGLIGMTSTSATFEEATLIAHTAKVLSPTTPIVIGGSQVSMMTTAVLDHPCFDYAVCGEGERTATQLVDVLDRGRPSATELSAIRGIIYRDGDRVVQNEPQPYIEDLDTLPFPALHLFDLTKYKFHRLMMTRACPYRCNYCVIHQTWGRKVRYRSVESVVAEIRQGIDRYGYKVFAINDDCFNCNPQYTTEFCRALLDQQLDVVWKLDGLWLRNLTGPLLDQMANAGCSAVEVGIQSMDDDVLGHMERPQSSEAVRKGLALLAERRIPVWGQFMIGNIGDSLQSVRRTMEFAKRSSLRAAKFYPVVPFYGTKLWAYIEKRGAFLPARDPSCASYFKAPDRINFVTPEFSYADRQEAHRLARQLGIYAALGQKRVSVFDDFIYYRLLNGRLFDRLSNRRNRQVMRALSLLATHAHGLTRSRKR